MLTFLYRLLRTLQLCRTLPHRDERVHGIPTRVSMVDSAENQIRLTYVVAAAEPNFKSVALTARFGHLLQGLLEE
jgi:hypothetical protein